MTFCYPIRERDVLDESGNTVPARDKNGKIIFDRHGDPKPSKETEPSHPTRLARPWEANYWYEERAVPMSDEGMQALQAGVAAGRIFDGGESEAADFVLPAMPQGAQEGVEK
jgi:hypothetical protein